MSLERKLIIAALAILSVLIAGALGRVARAQDAPTRFYSIDHREYREASDLDAEVHPPRRSPQVRAWRAHAPRAVPRAVATTAKAENEPDGRRCWLAVRTVGDQHITVEDAREEAVKAWRQQVRHDLGEKAADFDYAEQATFSCPRSSVGSLAGRVYYRCEIIARPCRVRHEPRTK
jgi:hypothetical protein